VNETKKSLRRAKKRARLSAGDVVADPLSYQGPWAKYVHEVEQDEEIQAHLAQVRAEKEAMEEGSKNVCRVTVEYRWSGSPMTDVLCLCLWL
jgi:hypothetical protein